MRRGRRIRRRRLAGPARSRGSWRRLGCSLSSIGRGNRRSRLLRVFWTRWARLVRSLAASERRHGRLGFLRRRVLRGEDEQRSRRGKVRRGGISQTSPGEEISPGQAGSCLACPRRSPATWVPAWREEDACTPLQVGWAGWASPWAPGKSFPLFFICLFNLSFLISFFCN